jgi:hypothetical protein
MILCACNIGAWKMCNVKSSRHSCATVCNSCEGHIPFYWWCYRMNDHGIMVWFPMGRFFCSQKCPACFWGPQPPAEWVLGPCSTAVKMTTHMSCAKLREPCSCICTIPCGQTVLLCGYDVHYPMPYMMWTDSVTCVGMMSKSLTLYAMLFVVMCIEVLIPWSRFHLNLTVPQLVKMLPEVHGTWRSVLATPCHSPCPEPHSSSPHTCILFTFHFNFLPFSVGIRSVLCYSGFPTKTP